MILHNSLEVHLEIDGETVQAGTLGATFSGGRTLGGSWFEYDRAYFTSPGAYELDPALPRARSRTYSGEDQKLFGAFQDLTPDDWGERVIDADLARIRARNPKTPQHIGTFDYLALASDETRLGAIRFRSEPLGEWLGESKAKELEKVGLDAYAAAAARLEAHEATEEDIELLAAPGTSMGGARPKVTAYMNGVLHLIKMPSERDRGRDGEAWEYVAIQIAKKAGINVQTGQLLTVDGGKSSLALKRFDRRSDGTRLGYMSARTAMELGDQTHNSATYEDLADVTDRLTGGNQAQLRDLFKRVALTVLINNVDDHWKNHGFLRDSHGWSLSPAFDINPSTSRGAVMSRPISGKDDPRDRDIRNLVDTASVYALSKPEASQALAEVLTATKKWADLAREARIGEGEISGMAGAFSTAQQAHAQQEISRLNEGRALIDLGQPKGDPEPAGTRQVWVKPHTRGGKTVDGFWRTARKATKK
jgi:serine/threonine-protein kinase HipA